MIFWIVHYNTPELTIACICSVLKLHPNAILKVFDNSDLRPLENLWDNVQIIDNTKNQYLNFNKIIIDQNEKFKITEAEKIKQKNGSNYGSFKHSISVQWIFENEKEDFILLDSDILLKKPIDFLDKKYACVSDVLEPNIRIFPFISYFNLPLLNEQKIKFCDYVNILPYTDTKECDTGGFLYHQIQNKKLPFLKINYTDYIEHYGNGSWKSKNSCHDKTFNISNNTALEWIYKYKNLWQ